MSDPITISSDDLSDFVGRMIPLLDEQQRRQFGGGMADVCGRGGLKLIAEITGMSKPTLIKGREEFRQLQSDPKARKSIKDEVRIRKEGGGRKSIRELYPEIENSLARLLDGNVVGNPENPLCWTTKSTYTLTDLLANQGIKLSPQTVGRLLKEMGFSLQQNRKYTQKAADSADRDAQFRFISDLCKTFMASDCPVISVDTKKKELVGNFKNNGAEYRPIGSPRKVNDHDFMEEGGRVSPYGIYDIDANEGFVNIGLGADTAEFAVASIRQWWLGRGRQLYPNAKRLMITADCGGSNGYRTRLWKASLQKLANETGLDIHVSHFPPGTSKWNKIEHLLFAQISRCWRGQPLTSIQLIVSLIAATTTKTGLTVRCVVDENDYERGIKVSDDEIAALNLEQKSWHGEWNYILRPVVKPA